MELQSSTCAQSLCVGFFHSNTYLPGQAQQQSLNHVHLLRIINMAFPKKTCESGQNTVCTSHPADLKCLYR